MTNVRFFRERSVLMTKLADLLKFEQTWFPTCEVPVRLQRLIRSVEPMSTTDGAWST